jgi:hypothetical protein
VNQKDVLRAVVAEGTVLISVAFSASLAPFCRGSVKWFISGESVGRACMGVRRGHPSDPKAGGPHWTHDTNSVAPCAKFRRIPMAVTGGGFCGPVIARQIGYAGGHLSFLDVWRNICRGIYTVFAVAVCRAGGLFSTRLARSLFGMHVMHVNCR